MINCLHILRSDTQSHGGERKTFEELISTSLLGIVRSLAFLLALPVSYQENPGTKRKLWNIISTEKDIPHMQKQNAINWKYIQMESS